MEILGLRIVAISDLHGDTIPTDTLPDGDVLVIAGDVLVDDFYPPGRDSTGTSRVQRQGWFFDDVWVPWLRTLTSKYSRVLWIGGNHDFFLDAMRIGSTIYDSMPEGVTYLNEELISIDGVLFYGAPWNMTEGWAFAIDESDYMTKLAYVPDDTDVLITHGPPANVNMPGFHYCSSVLAEWIRNRPDLKVVICGHIHEAYGTYRVGAAQIHVVSSKDRNYRMVNAPVIIDLPTAVKEPIVDAN